MRNKVCAINFKFSISETTAPREAGDWFSVINWCVADLDRARRASVEYSLRSDIKMTCTTQMPKTKHSSYEKRDAQVVWSLRYHCFYGGDSWKELSLTDLFSVSIVTQWRFDRGETSSLLLSDKHSHSVHHR